MYKNKRKFKINIREKEQSRKQLRVSRLINYSLMECFRQDARLSPILYGCPLTIIKVNISPDLRIANCFFVPSNTKFTIDDILSALDESKYIIRDYITKELGLRYSPEIRFFYDDTVENVEEVNKIFSGYSNVASCNNELEGDG